MQKLLLQWEKLRVNGDRPRLESTREMWSVPVNLSGDAWKMADSVKALVVKRHDQDPTMQT